MEMYNPEAVMNQLRGIAGHTAGWLKFLGVVNMAYGVLAALSILGLLVCWIPIWMGILLFQAGSRATLASASATGHDLVPMMEKLRTFFVIESILFIVGILFVIVWIIAVLILRVPAPELFHALRP